MLVHIAVYLRCDLHKRRSRYVLTLATNFQNGARADDDLFQKIVVWLSVAELENIIGIDLGCRIHRNGLSVALPFSLDVPPAFNG